MPIMDKVRKGTLPWMKRDALRRMILDDLLVEFQIGGLTEEEKEHWNHVWHRLKPWPDVVRGLERMKKNYVLATLSNGNVSLLVEMAKDAGLPWDAVPFTSSATAKSKPAPLNPKGAAPGGTPVSLRDYLRDLNRVGAFESVNTSLCHPPAKAPTLCENQKRQKGRPPRDV